MVVQKNRTQMSTKCVDPRGFKPQDDRSVLICVPVSCSCYFKPSETCVQIMD